MDLSPDELTFLTLIVSSVTAIALAVIGVFQIRAHRALRDEIKPIAADVKVLGVHTNSLTTQLAAAKLIEGEKVGREALAQEQASEAATLARGKVEGREEMARESQPASRIAVDGLKDPSVEAHLAAAEQQKEASKVQKAASVIQKDAAEVQREATHVQREATEVQKQASEKEKG